MSDMMRLLIGGGAFAVLVGYASWLEWKSRHDEILPPPAPDSRSSLEFFKRTFGDE